MKANPVGWFEIPVNDMDRAKAFYEQIFEIEFHLIEVGGAKMALFPDGGTSYGSPGSLMQYESYVPSHEGVLIYLSCADVQTELDRIENAGGKIMKGKTQISPEHGYMALFEDTEGNRIALHSRK